MTPTQPKVAQPKVAQAKPKLKKIASTPRAERSTAEGTPEVQNLLFYKQFETRLQELKQIWNEIRGQKPVKEEKTTPNESFNLYLPSW